MSHGSQARPPALMSQPELQSLLKQALGVSEPKAGHTIKIHSTAKTITKRDVRGREYQVTRPLVGALARQFPTLSRRERRQLQHNPARRDQAAPRQP